MTVRYTEWTQEKLEDTLDGSVATIGLTVRTCNRLEEKGLFTVRDLLNCTKADLMGIANFGEKTYDEVMLGLRNMGFY